MVTHRARCSAALCCLLAAASTQASSGPLRSLLADEADGLFTEVDTSVFQLVTQSADATATYGNGFKPTSFNVSLEMDTAATYSENWRDDDARTWEAGNTRINTTISWASNNLPAANNLSVFLYAQACSTNSAPAATSLFLNEANDSSSYIKLDIPTATTSQVSSQVVNFLINYDEARSMVLYNADTPVACTSLIPPMPDFPDEWSALLEANSPTFGVTFLMQLYYSQALQMTRADFSTASGSRIILQDFQNKNSTIITPANVTYPQGACEARGFSNFSNRFVDNETDLLVGTSDFLFFDEDNAQYQTEHQSVRGIECEEWKTSRTTDSGASFDVSYYFPVNQWVVARQDYHRLLKQVYINGTSSRGSFENYLNYVNLRPRNYSVDSTPFNKCAIAPMGHNCNCTKQEVADLVGLILNDDSQVVDVTSETAPPTEDICQDIPHGFVKQQAGPYIGLVILALVAGMGMMFAAMLVYFRAAVGVGLRDRVGHARFQGG